MAVWARDWRDQIWMKLINLILFCFNKVQKSISWNLLGFKIYKYSQNYYTHQMLYQKKFSIFSSTRLKILALLFFWPPFNRCQTSDFWTKCIISLNKQNLPKHDLFTRFNRSVLLDCSFSYNYHFFFPIFSNSTIKSISLFSFWTPNPLAIIMYTQIFIRLPLINI